MSEAPAVERTAARAPAVRARRSARAAAPAETTAVAAELPVARVAVDEGMMRLREDGLEKVRRGLTSIAEITRVAGTR